MNNIHRYTEFGHGGIVKDAAGKTAQVIVTVKFNTRHPMFLWDISKAAFSNCHHRWHPAFWLRYGQLIAKCLTGRFGK